MPSATPKPAPQPLAAPADSGMGASLLYNGLRAEVLAAQGQFQAAAQLMADVAKHEDSRPELYERATQWALMAGQPELGLKIVGNWRRTQSQSAPAARYALQLHLLLRQRDAAVAAMRDFLHYTKAEDLDSAMTVLPGYFALPTGATAKAATNNTSATDEADQALEDQTIEPIARMLAEFEASGKTLLEFNDALQDMVGQLDDSGLREVLDRALSYSILRGAATNAP